MLKIEVNNTTVDKTVDGTGQQIIQDLSVIVISVLNTLCATRTEAIGLLCHLSCALENTLALTSDTDWADLRKEGE